MTQTPVQTNVSQELGDYCAIRTATVILTCGNKRKRVLIAMDPCSNSTNIDADFAKEMGLKVEQTGIEREINFIEGFSLSRFFASDGFSLRRNSGFTSGPIPRAITEFFNGHGMSI